MGAVAEAVSEVVWTAGSAGCAAPTGAVGRSLTPPRAARTATSIFARSLRARRVRHTNGRFTVTPVVRMRVFAVGPRANSNKTQARPMPPKIAQTVKFVRYHGAPNAPSSTAGMIGRKSHRPFGQTTMDSRSHK